MLAESDAGGMAESACESMVCAGWMASCLADSGGRAIEGGVRLRGALGIDSTACCSVTVASSTACGSVVAGGVLLKVMSLGRALCWLEVKLRACEKGRRRIDEATLLGLHASNASRTAGVAAMTIWRRSR